MSRPNLFPALRYRNARTAIDWLTDAFGFEEQSVFANADGSIAHAELRLGPAVVGLSSAHDVPGNPWSEVRQGIYVHVTGVDAHHDRARAAGAAIAQQIRDTPWGSRGYVARDLEGFLWGFSNYRPT